VAGLAASLGSGAMTNSVEEMEDAELFLVIGSNTTEQHPMIGVKIIRAKMKGASLIVADPRKIPLARLADMHIQQKVGSDVALINGMIYVIVRDGLEDKAFITERTQNFDALWQVLEKYTPQRVSQLTGVPSSLIEEAAKAYAKASKAMIVYAMGITQHVFGTNNVRALANLALVTGHLGRPHTGVNPLRGQNNVQGACDMGGLPNVFSGYQPVSDKNVREKFEKVWGRSLPDKPGLTLTEMIKKAEEGELKALFIMGENPLVSDPDSKHALKALRRLEFLVVQDIFPTETSEIAHVILPAQAYAEKEGSYTNTERRVQFSQKVLSPIPGTRPDWEILCDLGERLGVSMNYANPRDVLEEINKMTPSYAGITYDRIKDSFGLQWPCPSASHPGTPYLYKDGFPKGKAEFVGIEAAELPEPPSEGYPFLLTTGRLYVHYHTRTMTKRIDLLEREGGKPCVVLNPKDAKRLGVREGMEVALESKRGEQRRLARISEEVPEGVVFASFHYGESNINQLTLPEFDPIAKIPELKACAVNIRRVS